jgi:hypothetical protein
MFEKKKNTMAFFITFFNGFATKNDDDNCHRLFRWFCYEEDDNNNVITFFYGGSAMRKAMLLPSLFSFMGLLV